MRHIDSHRGFASTTTIMKLLKVHVQVTCGLVFMRSFFETIRKEFEDVKSFAELARILICYLFR